MDLHQAAVLSCNFDLGEGKLYSVKWYKDEFEFFRYMPEGNPQILTFPLNGVNLDLSQSNMTVITLKPLELNSSGSYRCEVSTDGPNFETVVLNRNMTVMEFPSDDPVIDGIQPWYNFGDYITGNCTSARSNPAAELSWYINNNKAESWLLEKYPVTTIDGHLYSRALGLRFQVDKSHFGSDDRLELRCIAKIADLPHWERVVIVRPSYLRYTNEKPAPDRYSNNSGTNDCNYTWILIATTSYLLQMTKHLP